MVTDQPSGVGEISVETLFSKFDPQPEPVIDGKIERLPLHEHLTPENFERLVARLADPADGALIKAFRYGKSGSTQAGVDVMVIDGAAAVCDYYEGKRWALISKGDISAWVDKFLSGPHPADARKFVICTTFNVFEVTELALEWKKNAKLLGERQIDGDLWDGAKIHTMLRRRHSIVSELFGDEVAKRYCVPDLSTPSQPLQREFAAKRVELFGRSLVLENVSVRCDALLPTDDALSLGAILSFARSDLAGVSITLSGKELVHWMQWRAHAQPDKARPFACDMADGTNRAVLMAQSARLLLTKEEVEHLDWLLGAAWKVFFEHTKKLLLRYRCGRFKRLNGCAGPFVLASVKRSLWQAMLEFAGQHDFAYGNSSWHIFDAAPGCLKPYTRDPTKRFDSGYHTILRAYNEGSQWLPWESNVAICWEIPSNFGTTADVSARTNWDAEFTHDWLLEEFIPEVLRWLTPSRPKPMTRPSFLSWRAPPKPQRSSVPISSVAWSSAIGLSRHTVPDEPDELISSVQVLQSHFSCRRSDVDIEPALAKSVFEAIDRALTFAELPDEGHLRGCLGMSSEEDLTEGIRLRFRSDTQATSAAAMDFRLRGLLEILRAIKTAPLGEWRTIAAMLQPVLDRYNEDVVCDLFTAGR